MKSVSLLMILVGTITGTLLAVAWLIAWYRRWRRRRLDRAAAEKERRTWEGHRRDVAEEFLMEQRVDRRDWWLRKLKIVDKPRR